MSLQTKLYWACYFTIKACCRGYAHCEDGMIVNRRVPPTGRMSHIWAQQVIGMKYTDYSWRQSTLYWAAQHTSKLEGDIVECGSFRGYTASAMDLAAEGEKRIWMVDTWAGASKRFHNSERALYYDDIYEQVKARFEHRKSFRLVRGVIPDVLMAVIPERVCLLHLDLNSAVPERMALEYFWPRMTKGGIIVHDDYGQGGFEEQREMFDKFCQEKGLAILPMPTSPGIVIV